MKVKEYSQKISKITLASLIYFFAFLPFTNEANADGPHGWFVPFAEYLDDNLPPGCDPATETAVEISLVDIGTEDLIMNPIGEWNVFVYERDTGTDVDWYGYNGEKTSVTICFDPETEILWPRIFASPNYNEFHITTKQASENYPVSTRGHRFKGYVQLVSTASPDQDPFVSPVWPTDAMKFERTPSTFKVATYGEDNLYGAGSDVKTTRIHLTNHDTLEYFTKLSNTPGTVEVKDVPAPTVTTSGIYYWGVEQTMDGQVQTQKPGGPSWTFTNVPMSGLITADCFIVDKISPETKIINLYHGMNGPDMSLSIDNEISDIYAGIESTTIFVEDDSGTIVTTATASYDPEWETSYDIFWTGVTGLDPDETYHVYAFTVDLAGNTATSAVVSFNRSTGTSSPPIVVSPTVTNITDTSAELGATVELDGGSPLSETGVCWDTNADFSTERCDATATTSALNVPYTLTPTDQMPSGTTIYFRGYAINAVATGYSSSINFNTTGEPSLLPSITNTGVENVTQTSADLKAEVTSEGSDVVVERGTCWNTTGDFSDPPNTANCAIRSGGGLGEFTHSRSGLAQNTTIYYVSYAENSLGDRVYSVSTNFETGQLPFVTIQPATGVTDTEARLRATLDSDGSESVDHHGFCWNQGSSYNSGSATCEDLGPESAYSPFDHDITGLTTNTTYSYIAFAESDVGRYETTAMQFSTSESQPSTTFDVSPTTINYGESVTITWNSVNTDYCVGTNFDTGDNTSGTEVVTPPGTTSYDLDCYSSNGDTADTVSVSVLGAPTPLTDPELELIPPQNVIRAGDSIDLEWKMNNIPESMECVITGPSSFVGNPDATISHPPSPNPGTPEITGVINTGPLSSTQAFTLTCENTTDPTDTYSVDAEIKVFGNQFEI